MENKADYTALQIQVLSELEIDLWIKRSSPADSSPVSESIKSHPIDPVPEVVSTVPVAGLPIDVSAQAVEFDLVCMRNSHLLLVAQMHSESDEHLLGSFIRVSDTLTRGEKFVFKWPQLEANSGIGAARKAFLAFTSVQASSLETPVLVIFGREVTSLLSTNIPDQEEGAPQALTTFEWNGFSCITVPEVESLRLQWQLKRELCLKLVKLCPAIFKLHPTNSSSSPA